MRKHDDYHTHPGVTGNGDGTYTVNCGYDGQAWTIRPVGHTPNGEHFVAAPAAKPDDTVFSGSFNTVAFNVIGWES